MSTTVVYASGQSGYLYCSNATYLTAARGDGTFTERPAMLLCSVGQTTDYSCYEVFLTWGTSAVGTDTVTNVDFEVDGGGGSGSLVIEGYAYDWGSTLESADFRDSDSGIPALGSIISSYDSSGGWVTTAGYNNDLGANAAFNSAINGSGNTLIVLISQDHRNETAPTVNDYVTFECVGNTNDARLTITHASSVTYTYAKPDADVTTTGWATAPLWSKVDDTPTSPDGTVITATAS